MPRPEGKSFAISRPMVWEAWRQVKANKGAPGVDGQDLEEFEDDLRDNLYKIWNQMSSGSYFPPPVRAVEIPKPHGGGVRMLGVPTIADRVAQTVVAMHLEQRAEHRFHPGSYGYRPGRLAHDALAVCRQRCWKHDWVIDLDVQKFFDQVPWDLVVRAVETVTDARWVRLYVKRWLAARLKHPDGSLEQRRRELRRGRRSRRSWRTCSCTTRSTRGWPGTSRAARLSATPTMRSCIARAGDRPSMCSAGLPRG
jgi:RNA-directed DNA polymerase